MSKAEEVSVEVAKPAEGKKPHVKRVITARTLRRYDEKQLRTAIDYLIKEGLIPAKPELGTLKKLSKENLVKYPPTWAMAKVCQIIILQSEENSKNQPILTDKQKSIIEKLSPHTGESIREGIKSLNIDIKNMSSLKKNELINVVALHERSRDILVAVRVLAEQVLEEREKEKERKEKEKRRQEKMRQVEEELEEEEKEKKKKKKKRSSESDDEVEVTIKKKRRDNN